MHSITPHSVGDHSCGSRFGFETRRIDTTSRLLFLLRVYDYAVSGYSSRKTIRRVAAPCLSRRLQPTPSSRPLCVCHPQLFATFFGFCINVAMADGSEECDVAMASMPSLDILTGLQIVLKKALAHDGLARGLHEAAKAIEKRTAQLCVLAEDCNLPEYSKLVQVLCSEHNVKLISVPSALQLGAWAGLCKLDSEGKPRRVVRCSCVVIKDYGEESEGLNVVQEYLKTQ
ncbi:hypothetical protein GOP47_0000199 [Adiantum capillus-veneris]|uniref:40S ribosomal protein S12 n=1 Tax=Adiantum capillus-veneris TaxID=13818 RepID=A0A9D4VCK9_ADICA|nr:hypothetical protein GOP47_0000199 [Adiantum capillus-veneris]